MVTRRPSGAGAGGAAGGGRDGEAGYNLVILTIIVTVMSVLLAAAMPAWSKMAQREKEEELIFRGLQYAEAIRVFQRKFGRYPTRLEELIEVEPRSIRRLWKDPLTDSNRWGLIFAEGAPPPNPDGDLSGGGPGGPGGAEGEDDLGRPPRAVSGDPDQVTTGPIVGVYSLAEGTPIKTFLGKENYDEWEFTVHVLFLVPTVGGATPGSGPEDEDGRQQLPTLQTNASGGDRPLPDLSSRWTGVPWPEDLEIQMVPGFPAGAGTTYGTSVPNRGGGGPGGGGAPPPPPPAPP